MQLAVCSEITIPNAQSALFATLTVFHNCESMGSVLSCACCKLPNEEWTADLVHYAQGHNSVSGGLFQNLSKCGSLILSAGS